MTADRHEPDPTALDAVATDYLQAYRAHHQVPVAVKARVRQRLAAPERGRTNMRPWAVAAVVLAAAAVVVVAVIPREEQVDRATVDQAAAAPYHHAATGSDTATVTPQAVPTVTAAEAAEVPVADAVDTAPPVARDVVDPPSSGKRVASPAVAKSDDHGLDLAAERRQIANAWQALTQGGHARARELAAQHRREHPAGVLLQEGDAIAVIAGCAAKTATAAADAATFMAAHPRSPWLGQIRSACDVP